MTPQYVGGTADAPSYETEPRDMVKSTPVWRMALSQVSPSMPTHAEAE